MENNDIKIGKITGIAMSEKITLEFIAAQNEYITREIASLKKEIAPIADAKTGFFIRMHDQEKKTEAIAKKTDKLNDIVCGNGKPGLDTRTTALEKSIEEINTLHAEMQEEAKNKIKKYTFEVIRIGFAIIGAWLLVQLGLK